ncbi:hypothetical protein [Rhizobium favelukesii]|uniref:hypothetical protein n=1 Tax=Rhizobium favelukesii TaxID=348824 RepID=UPI00215F2B25|nr:hypothetical protein [Rhizobium favelukesii]MCS0459487.1 hypothetical protein [Rhizobium favelukesii]
MSWKRQRTSQRIDVEADLDDFDELQLLQALIDAKWISEDEAAAIEKRAATIAASAAIFASGGADDFQEATACLRRGNRHEALIHLERFLGRDWIGQLQ